MRKLELTCITMISLALAACAVGPRHVEPSMPIKESFTRLSPTFSSAEATAHFWRQFDDEQLDRLVSDALHANHDLRIALSRVREARAARGESRLDLAPTVTASAGYTRTQLARSQRVGQMSAESELFDAGFDAFWELDFFGALRRGLEARSAEVGVAEAGLRDAQTTVVAEVARTYFELRGQQGQLAVATLNVDNQTYTLKLIKTRLEAGRGTELDVSRAQAQLSATSATVGPLEAAIARSIHRLSVLTGREPTALNELLSPTRELPALPGIVATGSPAELLRRRPDIRAAERNLAAATARVGIAVADLFPKVTFVGSLGHAAEQSHALGAAGTSTYLVAPAITWAAFDLGRVRARIAGTRARADESLASYEQTVLRALEETENALVTHARERERLSHVTESERASRMAARLARARYDGGMVDFFEVLDAERTLLESQDRLAQSRATTATTLVAVYKALGGGWEGAPLPESGKDRLTVTSEPSRR